MFARTGLGHHLIADGRVRQQVLWRYFRIVVPHAMTHGHVEVIGAGHAAAIWYASGPHTVAIPGYAHRLAEATGMHLARFVDLDTARTQHRPAGPHHWLAYLAVRAQMRRQGLGVRLLEHHHGQLDTDGVAAYVEAIGARDSSLFARHGYEPAHRFPAGPGASLLYPMRREPRR